jgi:hypothetical protein
LKINGIPHSKNFQFLHVANLGYDEQFPQLCQHPIPNQNIAKNPGSDSTFESLMNFERDLNLLENLLNSQKIPS